ncbi:MAG: NAD(P)/FAD-dependent oxidoreductase [Gemmatimonadota bacterium]
MATGRGHPGADVLVIGAGVMGCSVAYQLAGRGLQVIVLEKDSIGAGSTGRSSAIIRQHYSHELTARMALYSLRVFENFEERVGGECGFRRTGWLGFVSEEERAGLEANLALQRSVGIRTGLVSEEELNELMPGLDLTGVAAAAYEPDSGYADPHLTVNAYAAAARRLGATIHLNAAVTGVRFSAGRVAGVDTTIGPFDAPAVVNCAGPWGARVARLAGLQVPVSSCRVQVAVFRRPPGHEGRHPVVIDFVRGIYLRDETGALTLAGSIDPAEGRAIVDPDDYPEHVNDQFVAAVGAELVGRHPAMADAGARGGYAGLYAVTPDWHPIVDQAPPGSGHFLCTGFSGHGFKLAPAVGRMVADLVTGEEAPMFPPRLFRLARFADGGSLSGRYASSIIG